MTIRTIDVPDSANGLLLALLRALDWGDDNGMSQPEETEPEASPYDPTLALLTVEEAARQLRIGRTTCYALIRSGELESVVVGRLRRVPAEAVPEYVARLRNSANTNCAA